MEHFISYTKYNNLLIFALKVERLDIFDTTDILKYMQTIIEQYASPHVLIDFSATKSISSSGLGMLISIRKQLEQEDRELAIMNISPLIVKVLKIMDMEQYFRVFNTLDEALTWFYREAESMVFSQYALLPA